MYICDNIPTNSSLSEICLDRICKANQNTHFVLRKHLSENRAVFDLVRKNMAQPDRSQMTM